MILSFHDLLPYFQGKFSDARIQEETNQIVFQLKVAHYFFPIFIKIFQEANLLQVMVFFPGNIQKGAEKEVAFLLHRINAEIDLPGFGMEDKTNTIFYRQMIPAFDQEISEKALNAYMTAIENVCKMFHPVILAVAYQKMSYHDVVKKLASQMSKK